MFNATTPLCECIISQELGCVRKTESHRKPQQQDDTHFLHYYNEQDTWDCGNTEQRAVSALRRAMVLRNAVEVSFDQSMRSNQWPDMKEDRRGLQECSPLQADGRWENEGCASCFPLSLAIVGGGRVQAAVIAQGSAVLQTGLD